jgi:hypothetical protein
MYDQYRELESSLIEISKCIGQVLEVVSKARSNAAETYLSATRAIGRLHAVWSRHLEFERELFPRMLSRDLFPAERLQRIAEFNGSIEKQLKAILAAPWPRSPQAGLQSIRIGVIKVLTPLLAQIEAERVMVLPAISRMDWREPAAARVEPAVSELVAT